MTIKIIDHTGIHETYEVQFNSNDGDIYFVTLGSIYTNRINFGGGGFSVSIKHESVWDAIDALTYVATELGIKRNTETTP